MTPPPLAAVSWSVPDATSLVYYLVGALVFVVFVVVARLVAQRAAEMLSRRQIRPEATVIVGRVVTFGLIGLGAAFAVSFAIQSANVALFGIVLATIIASFGVQDVLKDYVSGYYVLLERHIRVGDRISLEGAGAGTVKEVKLRVTLLQSDSGDLVVVPNSELFSKVVTVHVKAAERAAEAKPAPPE
ncbi:MAG TPA: mechanosensitive ion channel domain-containing protein [Candidatus Dormibacteraeota bacterium]